MSSISARFELILAPLGPRWLPPAPFDPEARARGTFLPPAGVATPVY